MIDNYYPVLYKNPAMRVERLSYLSISRVFIGCLLGFYALGASESWAVSSAKSRCAEHNECLDNLPEMVRLFPILSLASPSVPNQKQKSISCTSSLLKIKDRCALVTNAHCILPQSESVNLSFNQIPPPDQYNLAYWDNWNIWDKWKALFPKAPPAIPQDAPQAVSIPVLKVNRELDLAELEIPKALEPTCETLQPTNVYPVETFIYSDYAFAVASLGYLGGHPKVLYSGSHPWHGGYSPTHLSLYPLSKNPDAVLIMARKSTLIPGMSGGVSVGLRDEIVGINTRFIPFEDTLFVIPLTTVQVFLNSSSDPDSALIDNAQLLNQKLPPTAAFLSNNSTAFSGGGSHADGGGGSHVEGGDTDLRFQTQNPLSLFREPDEGVPDSQQAGAILLGVGGEQIDGTDDYAIKVSGSPKNSAPKIYREADGYAPFDIRKDILKRLAGTYSTNRLQLTLRREPDEHHAMYEQSLSSPQGWERFAEGDGMASITVNEEDSTISFTFYSHPVHPVTGNISDGLRSTQIEKQDVAFKVTLSQDAKTFSLDLLDTQGKPSLPFPVGTCKNNNYLKLICEGTVVEFSLSLDSVTHRALNYRFANLLTLKEKRVINFQYGWLKGETPPKPWWKWW